MYEMVAALAVLVVSLYEPTNDQLENSPAASLTQQTVMWDPGMTPVCNQSKCP